jgi:hypothetical protein
MRDPRDRLNVAAALSTEQPVASLRDAVVRELHERGADRGELLAVLEDYRREYRDSGREREQDAVTEIMERLAGWCGPDARI